MRWLVVAAIAAGCGGTTPRAPDTTAVPAAAPAGSVESRLEPGRARVILQITPAVANYLDERARHFDVPGMAVGLVAGGELVWTWRHGVADLDTGAPITVDTVFRIGSITKPITGVAILQLRDAGVLSLDDPVARWVPEIDRLRAPTADSPPITVRHLVTHTAGIGQRTMVDYWRTPDHLLTEAELWASLDGFALEHVPGTRAAYSNVGMGIAGLVVERASGVRYRDYATRHILQPLGMRSTLWERDDVPAGRLATGYLRGDDGALRPSHHWQLGPLEGMAGLYSTVPDLARFAAFQLAAWPPRGGAEDSPVLRRSSRRESHLVAGPAAPGDKAFGIAWRVRDDRDLGHIVYHNGGTLQYAGALWMLPERDLAIVILTNDGGMLDRLDDLARNALWIVAMHEARD